MKRQMKKALRSIVTLEMAALLILATAAPMWASGEEEAAKGTKPPVGLGMDLGIADFTSDGYGSGFIYALALNIPIDRKLSLTFSLGRTGAQVEEGVLEFGKGRLNLTPLTGSFNYHFRGKSKLVPYIYFGVAMNLYDFVPEATEPEQTSNIAHRIAPYVGVGLEYIAARDFGFGVDIRYAPSSTFVKPYSVVNPFPNDYPKIHLDTLTVNLILRYYF